jgi:hypothetical protein
MRKHGARQWSSFGAARHVDPRKAASQGAIAAVALSVGAAAERALVAHAHESALATPISAIRKEYAASRKRKLNEEDSACQVLREWSASAPQADVGVAEFTPQAIPTDSSVSFRTLVPHGRKMASKLLSQSGLRRSSKEAKLLKEPLALDYAISGKAVQPRQNMVDK